MAEALLAEAETEKTPAQTILNEFPKDSCCTNANFHESLAVNQQFISNVTFAIVSKFFIQTIELYKNAATCTVLK